MEDLFWNLDVKSHREILTVEIFWKWQWMAIQERVETNLRKDFKYLMVYKTLNNLAPDYMKNMFGFTKNIHSRQTRSSVHNKLYVPIELSWKPF